MLTYLPELRLNVLEDGPKDGPALVLAHALGLDATMWDTVLPLLPPGLRLIRLDMRGHGGSDTPPAPYAMGALVRDAERVLDHLGVKDAVFVGLSIGGLIAQGLAVKRLDLVRGLVLSNTAARIGNDTLWHDRIAKVAAGGMESIVAPTMERWFSRRFRAENRHGPWAARLAACRPEGWMGCAAAIAGADFYTPTAGLRLPVMAIAGGHDGSTPPDLVRETAALIPDADFHLLPGSGHLPPVDAPQQFAALLSAFLTRIGHI